MTIERLQRVFSYNMDAAPRQSRDTPNMYAGTRLRMSLCIAAAAVAGGCVTLDRDTPRTASVALTTSEAMATTLGTKWSAAAPEDPSLSAFRLLPSSLEALAARIALIDAAERSLDLQYYIFHGDETGLFLVDRLVTAADRGVRVRILIDDMYAHGIEQGLAVFDAHPNIELRLFNPWTQRGSKLARGLEFLVTPRLNHRMHNKLFVADGTAAIFGGRNLADEYFDLHAEFEFKDFDVVALGPVATVADEVFDSFWNGPDAIPITGLEQPDPNAALAAGRVRLIEHRDTMKTSAYAEAVRTTALVNELASRSVHWVFAKWKVVGDLPDKTTRSDDPRWSGALGTSVRDVFFGAERELLAASPYFVPRTAGTKQLCDMVTRGVNVRVLTNAFEATDVPVVHAGYSRYRTKLVRRGVEIFELRRLTAADTDDAASKRAFGSANASLHAKTFVVDRERVFIGSMNLDPRSVALNTEIGVLIESPELAESVARSILLLMEPSRSYRLVIGPTDTLNWISENANGEEIRFRSDPNMSLWDRFKCGMLGVLPIEGQI
jgi:cardiolipin synthase C